jgi:hypothetical protein
LTRTALLLLLLRHCSIPHGNVVVVAAICGVGIFASGNLRLLSLHCSVMGISWGLTLLLCWISRVVSVVVSTFSALAPISLLLKVVSEDQLVENTQYVLLHRPSP